MPYPMDDWRGLITDPGAPDNKVVLAPRPRLLPSLHAEEIKRLARVETLPSALPVAAKKLAAARRPQ